ncbi:MAG: hypothetical protein II165_05655, partial [Bacteroidales bacterium]|nr:hypothetical protein [Bacteroidales bacterium]
SSVVTLNGVRLLAMDDISYLFFVENFQQQDRWIEENFITNGGFIEDADLRLKIGNVYSLIELCKNRFNQLKESSNKAYDKYLNVNTMLMCGSKVSTTLHKRLLKSPTPTKNS